MKALARMLLALALAAPMALHAQPTVDDAVARINEFDDVVALVIVQELAANGDASAQELLGFMLIFPNTLYRTGRPAEHQAGVAWLAQAAAQGREPAAAMLQSLARLGDRDAQVALARAGAVAGR